MSVGRRGPAAAWCGAGMEVYNTNDIKSARTMYSYDKNNRLLNAVTTYVDGTTQREDYTYDANGNRTMKTASGTTKNYDYAQVMAGDGSGYGVTMYSYDVLGRMTGMQSGTTTASYSYDGAGLRQSKTVNGVTTSYVYDGTDVVREGSTYYTRGAAGLISKKSGARTAYYYTDYHGSVVRCGDEAYSYDAFGNQTGETEDSNPFRYSGEYYDEETGLIYLRARYYDSGVGAFTSADTHWNVGNMIYGDDNTGIPSIAAILQSGNLYLYCMGNPVNFWDPFGLELGSLRGFVSSYNGTVSDVYTDSNGEYVVINIPDLNVNKKYYYNSSENQYYVNSDGVTMMERTTFLDKMGVDYKRIHNVIEVTDVDVFIVESWHCKVKMKK